MTASELSHQSLNDKPVQIHRQLPIQVPESNRLPGGGLGPGIPTQLTSIQSGLMFFQLRGAENATPVLTNSQTALNSPGVTAEARVSITIKLDVGE